MPTTVTVDKSGATVVALQTIDTERKTPVRIRQKRYLDNLAEQDHRAMKRITKPMKGFRDYGCAPIILRGIAMMHRIRKGQMKMAQRSLLSSAEQFYSLAMQAC
jgi:putative transposase